MSTPNDMFFREINRFLASDGPDMLARHAVQFKRELEELKKKYPVRNNIVSWELYDSICGTAIDQLDMELDDIASKDKH